MVPVHAPGPRLLACLRALRGQEGGPPEIILSLDGRVDLPGEAPSLCDRIVEGPRSGPAAARNRGWRACSGDYVLFTDSDCIPSPGWAAALAGALDGGADGVKGAYSGGGPRMIQRLQQVEFEERYRALAALDCIDMVDTYSAGFRRDALEAAGGFDESFPAADHEDVDLSYRLRAMGRRLVFCGDALVEHRHRGTWAGYARMKHSRGRWRRKVMDAHPGRSRSDAYVPGGLKLQLALCAMSPVCLPAGLLAWQAAASWAALFLLSTVPMIRIAIATDPPCAPLVPFFALARGFALTSGLAAGVLPGGAA